MTANPRFKMYGAPVPSFDAWYTGLVNGDTSVVVVGLSFTTTATTGSGVGTYAITPGGASASNYALTYASGTLTVDPASLSVTADAQSKRYGAALPGLTYSDSGLVNGDTGSVFSGMLATTATGGSDVGTYAVTRGTLSAGPNYAINFNPGILSVTPAPLTVTAADAGRVYGQPNPAFTATYGGFAIGDSLGTLGGTLSFSTLATAASPVGSYAISPSGLSSNDYTITFVSGTLAITPAPGSAGSSTPGGLNPAQPAAPGSTGPSSGTGLGEGRNPGSPPTSGLGSPPAVGAGHDPATIATAVVNGVAAALPLVSSAPVITAVALPTPESPAAAGPVVSSAVSPPVSTALPSPAAPSTSSGGAPAPALSGPAPLLAPGPNGTEGVAIAGGSAHAAGATPDAAANGPQTVPQALASQGPAAGAARTRADKGARPDRSQGLREGLLWSAIELFEDGLEEKTLPYVVQTIVGVSVVASTGYVLLNSRAIYFLISVLTSRPLWKGFDPLEVIFAWEEEQEDEERRKTRRPHFWSRRKDRDEESLQSLVAEDAFAKRELEEVAR